MNIEFVAFAKFDFYELAGKEDVLEVLEDIYEEEGEVYGGPTFGGGGWRHRVFGNTEENPLEEDEDIRWIRTLVNSEIRGVLDVATLGILSDSNVNEILAEEDTPRNEYNRFKHKISEYFNEIPTVIEDQSSLKAYVTYIEPDEEFDFRTNGEVDIGKIQKIIEANAETLSRFEYPVGGYQTLYQGNYILNNVVSQQPYSRISVFTRGIDREHNAPEELQTILLERI
ncbi:MAG: hypothetical protein ABEI86_13660 [Halobacteriaceae archaeon]